MSAGTCGADSGAESVFRGEGKRRNLLPNPEGTVDPLKLVKVRHHLQLI